jgi:cytochrome c peroxidase
MRPDRDDNTANRNTGRRRRRPCFACTIVGVTTVAAMASAVWAERSLARDATGMPHASSGSAPLPAPVWRAIFERPGTIPAPTVNPLTPVKIALGKQLFFDKRLSGDGTRACASCHQPALAFTDGRVRARGLSGRPLARNTPAIWNLAWAPRLHWDGSFASLEAQARAPIEHTDELNGNLRAVVAQLNSDTEMRVDFAAAFPSAPRATPINLLRALASYTRTRISPQTRFDHWIGGDRSALTMNEYAGFRLFVGKAGCLACHGGWRLTNDKLHDIGLPATTRAFKTPSLRLVSRTAPYMHDGSLPTLASVVRHYTNRIQDRPSLAPQLRQRAHLSSEERALLVAFLRTL